MPTLNKQNTQFLAQLQSQAKIQQSLSRYQVVPEGLQPLAAFFIQHAWQSLALTSFLAALLTTALNVKLHIL